MAKRFYYALAMLVILSACGNSNDNVAGSFAHERTWERKNGNGAIIGNTLVRDTLIITAKGNGYEVVNKVWHTNSFDSTGWQERAHSNAMRTHIATYDKKDRSLNAEMSMYPPLHFDEGYGTLSTGDKKLQWKRVK